MNTRRSFLARLTSSASLLVALYGTGLSRVLRADAPASIELAVKPMSAIEHMLVDPANESLYGFTTEWVNFQADRDRFHDELSPLQREYRVMRERWRKEDLLTRVRDNTPLPLP